MIGLKRYFGLVILLVVVGVPAWGKTLVGGVSGMVCGFCAQGIEKTLMKEASVAKVQVSLEEKQVRVELKEGGVMSRDQLRELLKSSGYDLTSFKEEE